VFARSGSVVVQRPLFGGKLIGNSVTGGTGYRSGAAAGSGLFLMSGVTTTFEIAGVYTIDDAIADDSPVGVPAGQSYTPGNGGGEFVFKTGPGILVLNGANAYAGLTSVLGGAIGGNGVVPSAFYVDGAGALMPGDPSVHNGVGTLATGPLNWAAGGAMDIQIGSNQAGSDLLVVNGPLTKNGSGTWHVNFGVGDNPPKPGATYTLIQSTDASAFAAADFAPAFDTSLDALAGTFSIAGNAVKFTVDTVSSNLIFRSAFD
jgi:autotransporter-associated beta strand protein